MLFFILCRKEFGRHSSLQWLLWGKHQHCFIGCFFPKCRWDVLVWKVSHKLCQWPNSGMLGPTYRQFSLSLADSAVRSDQAASGLYQVKSWKPPRMGTAQMVWGLVPLRGGPEGEIWFSLYPVWTSFVSIYAHCLLSSCHAWLSRTGLHLLSDLAVVTGGLLLEPPKLSLLHAEQPSSHSLFTQGPGSNPNHLDGHLLNLPQFIDVFPILGAQNWT